MTEILTESFCERCGTRYTFETARPRNSRIGRAKTFTRGLRNYVLSDDSFSEAMADARGEEELAATVLQLDAFHKTFNFCLSCRQYTCGNCWNASEGRCLSCAPLPGSEPIEELEPGASEAIAGRLAAIAAPPEVHPEQRPIGIAAWPAADLAAPQAQEAAALAVAEPAETWPEAAAGPEAEAAPDLAEAAPPSDSAAGSVAEAAIELDLGPTAAPGPVAEPRPVEAPEPTLQGLKPGESLDDAIAAYEASHTAAERSAPAEPELTAALAADTAGSAVEELVQAEAEAVAAQAEPVAEGVEPATVAEPPAAAAEAVVAESAQPEAVFEADATAALARPAQAEPAEVAAAAAPPDARPEPLLQPEPPLAPPPPPLFQPAAETAPPAPLVEEPIAATAAPAPSVAPPVAEPTPSGAPGAPDALAPGWLTVAPDDGSAPAWTQGSAWTAAPRPVEGATLAGRRLLPTSDAAALWAASAQEVMQAGPVGASRVARGHAAAPTPQPCVGCGLSLSANARFCRRCGARQP